MGVGVDTGGWGLDILGRFFIIFTRKTTFCNFKFYLAAHQSLSEKDSSLTGTNLLPPGANSFLLE